MHATSFDLECRATVFASADRDGRHAAVTQSGPLASISSRQLTLPLTGIRIDIDAPRRPRRVALTALRALHGVGRRRLPDCVARRFGPETSRRLNPGTDKTRRLLMTLLRASTLSDCLYMQLKKRFRSLQSISITKSTMSSSFQTANLPKRPPSFNGINHIKLPCHSIQRTLDFYTTILPFELQPHLDHFTPDHKVFARMLKYNNILLELRYNPEQALAQKGWDPITWGVSGQKHLREWKEWFHAKGVKCSDVFTALKSWVLAAEDPDGRVVRLYVEDEEHEWTLHPSKDEYWLGQPKGDPEAGV